MGFGNCPQVVPFGRQVLKTQQLPRYLFRSAIGVVSMLCGFWAIGHLPLAQAISLSYSTPLFVTIAAVLFLHEKVRMRRWSRAGSPSCGASGTCWAPSRRP